MKVSREVKDALRIVGSGGSVVYLTTVSREGVANIVGERFVSFYRDEYILIAEMFAQKTRVNLNENPHSVITLAHPLRGRTWSFSGLATILQEGFPEEYQWEGLNAREVLDEWGDWALKEPPSEVPPDIRPPVLVQRGVIAFHIQALTDFHPLRAGEIIRSAYYE
jgi:hypothetical protein